MAPVIAEVLLVAMSVTLAGTVLIMSDNLMSQSIPSSPYVGLLPPQVDGGIARIEVADASSAAPVTNYEVRLETSSASGPALPLDASGAPENATLGGITYTVAWTPGATPDVLTGGSWFRISAAGGPLPAGAYTFLLVWRSTTVAATVSFTV